MDTTEITVLALCEAERVVLRSDRVYRFAVDTGCPECLRLRLAEVQD